MNLVCSTVDRDADITGGEHGQLPAMRHEDGRQHGWLTADADDLKNSIVGYLTLSTPFVIAVLGLFVVTRP